MRREVGKMGGRVCLGVCGACLSVWCARVWVCSQCVRAWGTPGRPGSQELMTLPPPRLLLTRGEWTAASAGDEWH